MKFKKLVLLSPHLIKLVKNLTWNKIIWQKAISYISTYWFVMGFDIKGKWFVMWPNVCLGKLIIQLIAYFYYYLWVPNESSTYFISFLLIFPTICKSHMNNSTKKI